MCNKHSFLVDKNGKVYNGYGILESHTHIAKIHDINEDNCNKYEYDPNNTNDKAYGITGLLIDSDVFTANKTVVDAIEKYITTTFPTVESWENYSNINTPVAVLKQLSNDSDWRVRGAVASKPNTPAAVLKQLSNDSDWGVRRSVASNIKNRGVQ